MSRTVLVADNNAFYRQVLGDFLREEGYRVEVASDGVEALERITAGGVDLLLLDLIMPRIDGGRLCRFLKSQESYASMPIVILSGILADEIEGFDTIRADAYVAKMPMDLLQPMLRKVLADLGTGREAPVLEGFEKMYRREVVLELLDERRAREIIQDSLSEGIVELSGDRRILRTNRAFEAMVGRSGSDLLSGRIEDLFDESREAVAALFDRAAERPGAVAGAVLQRRGRSLRLRLHLLEEGRGAPSTLPPRLARIARENPKVRLMHSGKLPGYVLLIEDVTEERRAREERELFRERMARSERMSALGHFVAGAAHELNNPLTAVLGYAQLLAGRTAPAEMKEGLRKIQEGAARCQAIVENLLVFSRRGIKERRRCALGDLVQQAVAECLPRAAAAKVEILTIPAPGPIEVEADTGEMVQALVAVLDNAVRAAAGGRLEARVRVRTSASGRAAAVEVADSGAGIPGPILDKIFDPFFTTREVGQGKGLGLSVAYGIARAHGGSIEARNVETGGAAVTLRVPLAGAREDEEAAGRGSPEAAPARSGARILVVDDEPVVCDLISDALGAAHRVETAPNGREGLARAARGAYDVILLDMKMPDMTGRQMFEALAALNPAVADRVIFTTGDTVHEETRRFLGTVANPCLAKPFSLEALAEAVERILAAARPA